MNCPATIAFGDDYGDNESTFCCILEKGHEGSHQTKGDMGWYKYSMPYTLTWEGSNDELEKSYPPDEDE